VLGGLLGQSVDEVGAFHVEGEVVEAGAASVVVGVGEVRGLLNDDVGWAQPPAAAGGPGLEYGVAEPLQQPSPADDGAVEIGYPYLYVVRRSRGWPAHAATLAGPAAGPGLPGAVVAGQDLHLGDGERAGRGAEGADVDRRGGRVG
jgi:hypothetical protein